MARGMKRNAMKHTKQKKASMKAARAGRRQDEFSDVSSSPGDGGADKGLLHAGDETFLFAAGSGGVAAAVEKLAGEIQKLSVDLEPPVGVLENLVAAGVNSLQDFEFYDPPSDAGGMILRKKTAAFVAETLVAQERSSVDHTDLPRSVLSRVDTVRAKRDFRAALASGRIPAVLGSQALAAPGRNLAFMAFSLELVKNCKDFVNIEEDAAAMAGTAPLTAKETETLFKLLVGLRRTAKFGCDTVLLAAAPILAARGNGAATTEAAKKDEAKKTAGGGYRGAGQQLMVPHQTYAALKTAGLLKKVVCPFAKAGRCANSAETCNYSHNMKDPAWDSPEVAAMLAASALAVPLKAEV